MVIFVATRNCVYQLSTHHLRVGFGTRGIPWEGLDSENAQNREFWPRNLHESNGGGGGGGGFPHFQRFGSGITEF